jgi:hypothetical protein
MNTFTKKSNPLDSLGIGRIAIIKKWFEENDIEIENCIINKTTEKDYYVIVLYNINFYNYTKLKNVLNTNIIHTTKYNFNMYLAERYKLVIKFE